MTVLPPPVEKQNTPRTFIDALLAEEHEWTAVDRFSNWHDLRSELPLDPSYRRLIPLAQPKPGQQYAFEVDLEKCSGCKACVAACHSLNGLDEVPQYSGRLGIVRKCDMCYHRLAVGEAPACAQACPSEAIRITIVDQTSISAEFRP